jgi:hypothetical protein
MEGTTALTFETGSVGASEFAVSAAVTTPSGTGITIGGISGDDSTTCTIGVHSAAADGTDSFVITYTITGKIADGTSFSTITKTQTLTKQKEGDPGDPGSHGSAYFSITSADAAVTSDRITNTKIQTATGRTGTVYAITGDTCTVISTSSSVAPASYNYNGSAWEAATMQIDGSLVATGTIAGGAIQSATTITVGSAGQVLIDGTTNRILITD